ncbi:MAG: P-II family nitrogen regulator [Candidatus Omnitrophica bacterium]|nr:P-II family nitrogen regulator [Candidatus Omnitrophota bacterium]
MKLITAIIQPDKLDEVREALIAKQIGRVTVSRVSGRGQSIEEQIYRGQDVGLDLISKIRIDIACDEKMVEVICETIMKAARHEDGKIGDGKIFVTPLDECIRIRTGERGMRAL